MSQITLHQGDCLEYLKTLKPGSVDAVVTDPPYGIAHKSNGQRFRSAVPISGDNDLALAESVIDWAKGIPLAMFYSPYRPLATKWRSVLVWSKGGHTGIGGDRETCWKRDAELVGVKDNKALNGKRDSCVLPFNARQGIASGHFCEKPIGLMVYLIEKLTQPGDIILDPFMGSGTTGVACVRTGRNFIGCEIDPTYFAIAQRRIADEQAKTALLETAS